MKCEMNLVLSNFPTSISCFIFFEGSSFYNCFKTKFNIEFEKIYSMVTFQMQHSQCSLLISKSLNLALDNILEPKYKDILIKKSILFEQGKCEWIIFSFFYKCHMHLITLNKNTSSKQKNYETFQAFCT